MNRDMQCRLNCETLWQRLVTSGYTITTLAKRMKVSRFTVYLWFEGRSFPTLKHLTELTRHIGAESIDELVVFKKTKRKTK